jgi:ribosomal protein L11 methyltransferase
MLALFPEGFEERDGALVAYTDRDGERRVREAFEDVEATDVEPGWEDAWRAFHRPVRIGPLWVGPPWLDPDPGSLAVVVDPGRAFGTGAHPTTRLCLELLLEQEPTSVLDLGCGSGVLAIAAAKLGFGPAVALDDDPVAVEAARANAAANGVAVDVRRADALSDELPGAGLALANVTSEAVRAIAGRIQTRFLVASGYLEADRPEPPGWTRLERRSADGWAADLFSAAAADAGPSRLRRLSLRGRPGHRPTSGRVPEEKREESSLPVRG